MDTQTPIGPVTWACGLIGLALFVALAAAIYVLVRGFECALLVLYMPLPYLPAG
ncbi:hypothetical protein JQ636_21975 [Bradyrhizobium japonicum]|uniref:hypothetical protein n=1 Tax=Bradyrhizobium japonicum TaxID=375 RepID=UPI001BAC4C63|nr:hypothetical protein [Bradyrhizobium japonicum]MBR0730642.1 hypothetical protein [Bradyrhizobium japonicum]MBR0806228.1 hypothetical protein [Bradyrhizobium japonicum]